MGDEVEENESTCARAESYMQTSGGELKATAHWTFDVKDLFGIDEHDLCMRILFFNHRNDLTKLLHSIIVILSSLRFFFFIYLVLGRAIGFVDACREALGSIVGLQSQVDG